MKKVTKKQQQDYLKDQLSTNPNWAKKALLKIYENQTEEEMQMEDTAVLNGIGFTGADGQILSSFASQLIRKNFLSPRQMEILMKKMKKYWKQILDISDVKKLNAQIVGI